MLLNGSDIAIFLRKGNETAELRPVAQGRELAPEGVAMSYIFPIPENLVGCDIFEIKRSEYRLLFQCDF